jgi:hypothetical protein
MYPATTMNCMTALPARRGETLGLVIGDRKARGTGQKACFVVKPDTVLGWLDFLPRAPANSKQG